MTRRAAGTVLIIAASALLATSCASAPIEEIARNNLRAKADDALKTFTQVVESTDPASVGVMTERLKEAMPGVYSVISPQSSGYPEVDIYLRDHVTLSGGLGGGQQRTVSSCIRYSYEPPTASMRSIECPATEPQSEYADERVTIP